MRVLDGRPSDPWANAQASSHLPQAMQRSTDTLKIIFMRSNSVPDPDPDPAPDEPG
jgi:hypothetical protein